MASFTKDFKIIHCITCSIMVLMMYHPLITRSICQVFTTSITILLPQFSSEPNEVPNPILVERRRFTSLMTTFNYILHLLMDYRRSWHGIVPEGCSPFSMSFTSSIKLKETINKCLSIIPCW